MKATEQRVHVKENLRETERNINIKMYRFNCTKAEGEVCRKRPLSQYKLFINQQGMAVYMTSE